MTTHRCTCGPVGADAGVHIDTACPVHGCTCETLGRGAVWLAEGCPEHWTPELGIALMGMQDQLAGGWKWHADWWRETA
jgi:hypothetical protein